MNPTERKRPWRRIVRNAAGTALVIAALALWMAYFVRAFVCDQFVVPSESMLPTLENGERLVISHLFYEPSAGDIVVLCGEADHEEGKNLIKRIIATGGQTVDIDFELGQVYVDGEALSEPYTLEPTYLDEGTEFPLTVPEGEIFVMGDNRNNSEDSRFADVGFVPYKLIKGKAVLVFWPLSAFKTLP